MNKVVVVVKSCPSVSILSSSFKGYAKCALHEDVYERKSSTPYFCLDCVYKAFLSGSWLSIRLWTWPRIFFMTKTSESDKSRLMTVKATLSIIYAILSPAAHVGYSGLYVVWSGLWTQAQQPTACTAADVMPS